MFDLEKEIKEWRERLTEGGIQSPAALDELEGHLRDDIARQTQAGVEASAAFETAVQRIGNAGELKSEFENACGGRKHWWQASLIGSPELEAKLGAALLVGIGWLFALGLGVCILFRLGGFSDMTAAQQVSGLLASALIGIAVAGGRRLHPYLSALTGARARTAAILTGIAVVFLEFGLLFYGILPRVVVTEGQLIAILLWMLVPWAVSIGIVAGIQEAARRRTTVIAPS